MRDERPTVQVDDADEREPGEGRQIEERPRSEEKFGLFFSPATQGGGGFYVPMHPLKVGPGEPGPADEWHAPAGPIQTEDEVVIEQLHPGDTVLLPLRRADKR